MPLYYLFTKNGRGIFSRSSVAYPGKRAVTKRLFCNSPYRYRALWPRRYKLRFRYVLCTRYALRGTKERYPIEFGTAEYIEVPWAISSCRRQHIDQICLIVNTTQGALQHAWHIVTLPFGVKSIVFFEKHTNKKKARRDLREYSCLSFVALL